MALRFCNNNRSSYEVDYRLVSAGIDKHACTHLSPAFFSVFAFFGSLAPTTSGVAFPLSFDAPLSTTIWLSRPDKKSDFGAAPALLDLESVELTTSGLSLGFLPDFLSVCPSGMMELSNLLRKSLPPLDLGEDLSETGNRKENGQHNDIMPLLYNPIQIVFINTKST